MDHRFTNALALESSPYLLQHAHNPVNWFPWGEEAWQQARKEDKPVIVSIGYSACHWCHVMERESFEDEAVAAFMNEHFINIKIDREERPDLDQIYMDAVTAISGSGGWPLNVFLTPDRKPFYGGTYFPPRPAFNRPSWMNVLQFMAETWSTRRQELEEQAGQLTDHIRQTNRIVSGWKQDVLVPEAELFIPVQARSVCEKIMQTADRSEGGFGRAPKFPQFPTIQYLLAHSVLFNDAEARQQAELTLNKMLRGGIYDHLAGGLARYSTDTFWLVPHFEKMLYDNALLVITLADAFRLTGNLFYRDAIDKTLCYLLAEAKDPAGGFYAALDADSEGEEGRFYIWDYDECRLVLGTDADSITTYFAVTPDGNWEGKNILTIPSDPELLAQKLGISSEALSVMVAGAERKLLDARNKRIRPQTDDKILLGWNALTLTALCKAYAATGREEYKSEALELGSFLLQQFKAADGSFFHTYKNGLARYPAFLDDYAYLIQGLLSLQEISSDQQWLVNAMQLAQLVIDQFSDMESGYFFYTAAGQDDLVARKLDLFDQATPSGNAVMAANLKRLALLADRPDWGAMARNMLSGILPLVLKYPGSLAVWGYLILEEMNGLTELVLTGEDIGEWRKQALSGYNPFLLLQSCENESDMPLLKNRFQKGKRLAYVCRNAVCQAPVSLWEEVKTLIKITTI